MAMTRDQRLRTQMAVVLTQLRGQPADVLRRLPAQTSQRVRFQRRVTTVTTFHQTLPDGMHRFVVRGMLEDGSDPQTIVDGFDLHENGARPSVEPVELYGFIDEVSEQTAVLPAVEVVPTY